MNKGFQRNVRVAELLKRELASIIRLEMNSIHTIITAVRVSRDLSAAKIYVTTIEENACSTSLVKSLNESAKFLRSCLAKAVTLKKLPNIRFLYDESIDHAKHISDLLKSCD